MKRTVFCGILAVIVLAGACAKKSVPAETPAAEEVKEITVRLLTDASGIDDKSFNAASYRGILDYYGDTWQSQANRSVYYDWLTTTDDSMYIPDLQSASDKGYDLIVATGFSWVEAMKIVAPLNEDQKYLIVDVDWLNFPNVMQAVYAEHEGSYLVGLAAAIKAKDDGIANPSFGFIGGVQGSVITKFEVGYIQGILSVFPNARIVDYYTGDWGLPELAKIKAREWYDNGVYAIYSAAGSSGNGTIEQAREYRLAGKNVWAIGVDSDQYEEGLYGKDESAVLTSMLKRVETSVVYALKAVKKNTFKGEVIVFDLKSNGVGYSFANSAMTAGIKSDLEKTKRSIISGEIKIAATYAEAKKLPGFPQNLLAIDE